MAMKGSLENPAVFSSSGHLIFAEKIPGRTISRTLGTWLEGVRDWLKAHDYIVGHLKILAEGEGERVRLSLTKGSVNHHPSSAWQDMSLGAVDLYVTLIVFGPDHDTFQREAATRMADLSRASSEAG